MTTTSVSYDENHCGTDRPDAPSLADVLAMVPCFDDVSEPVRRNMASSIRTLCRVLDRDPRHIHVAASAFRYTIQSALPGATGVSTRHWHNVVSNVRRAIRLSGLGGKKPALNVPLTEEWQCLISRSGDRWTRNAIERLGMFCSARQLNPCQVDDVILGRYLVYLEETQLTKNPARTTADLARKWNACVDGHEDWPGSSLTVPNRSRKYALDWNELLPSLEEDANAFREQSINPDILDIDAPRPVKPKTARQRDALIRRLATALVTKGVSVDDLNSLADLVRPDRLKLGLRFFLDRNGDKTGAQVHAVAQLGLLIARRWSKLSQEEVRLIEGMCGRVRHKPHGLTEKNKARLRQFSDAAAVQALLGLPRKLVAKAKRLPPSRKRALTVQTALAIEILIFAPIRLGNLVSLDRNRHFVQAGSNGKRVLHLVIPSSEVKNNIDLEFPLPEETVELLDLYMEKYQPDLVGAPSTALFPGKHGGPKRENGAWRQICKTIRREIGLEMNPHLFRHWSALLYLERHPGEYEVVRRVLGHKSINTTLSNYTGLETTAALKRFDETILSIRPPHKYSADHLGVCHEP